jgi:hypothetical protein
MVMCSIPLFSIAKACYVIGTKKQDSPVYWRRPTKPINVVAAPDYWRSPQNCHPPVLWRSLILLSLYLAGSLRVV